jgi:hypothetical protein
MSSVTINRRVRDSLTSATTGTTYKYRVRKGHDVLRYSLQASTDGGALTATCKLEVSDPGAAVWVDVPSGSFTAETSGTFVPGKDCDIRWNVTAYTAGTLILTIT